MATKKTNVLTSKKELIDAYKAFLNGKKGNADAISERENEIKELEKQIKDIETASQQKVDEAALTLLSVDKTSSVFTQKNYSELQNNLKNAQARLKNIDAAIGAYNKIYGIDLAKKYGEDKLAKALKAHYDYQNSKDEKGKDKLNKANKAVDLIKKQAQEDVEKASKAITQFNEDYRKFKQAQDAAKANVNSAKEAKNQVPTSAEIKSLNTKIASKKVEIENLKKATLEDSIETFEKFLKAHNISTYHIESLWEIAHGKGLAETDISDDFTIRKLHDKRDFWLKDVLAPSLAVGGIIGAVTGGVAASHFISGEQFTWFQITGNSLLDFVNGAVPAAIGGAAVAAGTILTVDAITRAVNKAKCGNVKDLVDKMTDLNNDAIDILDHSKIVERLTKISDAKEDMFEAQSSKKKLKAWAINKANRNRVHAVESYLKNAINLYAEISKDVDSDEKTDYLKNLDLVINKINSFIVNDIEDSMVYIFTNCDDNGKHYHKDLVENLDIYANLLNYTRTVKTLAPENAEQRKALKTELKDYKAMSRNAEDKLRAARELLLTNPNAIVKEIYDTIKSLNPDTIITETQNEVAYLPTNKPLLLESSATNQNVQGDNFVFVEESEEKIDEERSNKPATNEVVHNKNKTNVLEIVKYKGRNITISKNPDGTKIRYSYPISGGNYRSGFYKITDYSVKELVDLAKKDIDGDLANKTTSIEA